MSRYQVAICDDEKSELEDIVQNVKDYDVQGYFDIETYADGNVLLSELQMQKKHLTFCYWILRCHPMVFSWHKH